MYRTSQSAFTLIELLIVVAIIAILAAIAVPNFLEAQTRSKVSRAMTDMRTIAVAIESYAVDQNRGPIGCNEGRDLGLWTELTRHYAYNRMTTPIAYLGSVARDPFTITVSVYNVTQGQSKGESVNYYEYQHMQYQAGTTSDMGKAFGRGYIWYLRSTGPDRVVGDPYLAGMVVNKNPGNVYDPTNGTVSYGDIHLTNKGFYTGAAN